jgi:hypothetical protein
MGQPQMQPQYIYVAQTQAGQQMYTQPVAMMQPQYMQPMAGQPQPMMVPQQMAPQQMAPQQMAPQQMAPQQMAPQQMAPQQMVSQQMAPQQMVPQQMVSQQMAVSTSNHGMPQQAYASIQTPTSTQTQMQPLTQTQTPPQTPPPGYVMMGTPAVYPTSSQQVQQQPMPAPKIVWGTPEDPYIPLKTCSSLLIEQDIERSNSVCKMCCTCGINNRYKVFTDDGGLRYTAVEDSKCYNRCCCGSYAPVKLNIHSVNDKSPVLFTLDKPHKLCCPACFEACQKEATLHDSKGTIIAHLKQPLLGGCCSPQVELRNHPKTKKFATLSGSACCIGGYCCPTKFSLKDDHKTNLGQFERRRHVAENTYIDASKTTTALSTSADIEKYEISFDVKADTSTKAALLGALLFLDYIYFEGNTTCKLFGTAKCCDLVCCGQTVPCRACGPCAHWVKANKRN